MADRNGTLSDVGTGYPRLNGEFLAKQNPTSNPFRNADDYLVARSLKNSDYVTVMGNDDVVGGQYVFMMTSAKKAQAVTGAQPHNLMNLTADTTISENAEAAGEKAGTAREKERSSANKTKTTSKKTPAKQEERKNGKRIKTANGKTASKKTKTEKSGKKASTK